MHVGSSDKASKTEAVFPLRCLRFLNGYVKKK